MITRSTFSARSVSIHSEDRGIDGEDHFRRVIAKQQEHWVHLKYSETQPKERLDHVS